MASIPPMMALDHQLEKLGFEVCGDMNVEAANSSLYLALATETNTPVVIKELNTPTNAARLVALEEAGIMAALQHKHIVSLHATIDFRRRILLVMQLGQQGDLFELIQNSLDGRLAVSESKRLFVQLILALEHMHKCGFLHLDIKPDNIFLDNDGNVLLGDFGLSIRRPRSSKMVARGGTLHYSAPESFLGAKVWGPELDIWSAGVVLFVMLRGCYPFWADNDAGIAHSISFQDADVSHLPDDAADLLKRMLCKNPAQRITINQLKRHAFVRAEFLTTNSFSSTGASPSTMETASELRRSQVEGN